MQIELCSNETYMYNNGSVLQTNLKHIDRLIHIVLLFSMYSISLLATRNK